MKVGVLGIGHVGLPTAAALAHFGHDVVAADIDQEKLAMLAKGVTPYYEPGLEEMVREEVAAGRLRFVSDVMDLQGARVAFICVGTPPRMDGEANLVAVEQAAELLATAFSDFLVVVEKSTVPAGTAMRIEATLRRHNGDSRFAVVSNPEFLREGRAIEDSLHPTRILVGSDSQDALDIMRELYAPVVEAGAEWIETDVRTAELAKHACNAFLATKISFANALASICEAAGADVRRVADTMGSDPRIGRSFLDAGLGYGGYCFPKDLAAFRNLASRLGYDFRLLDEVARINEDAVERAYRKVEDALWNLEGKRVALLGLAFKPGTDDLRFAPAMVLARRLLDAGARVTAYDPQAGTGAKQEIPEMEIAPDAYSALDGAHCVVLCTEWEEFRQLDLAHVRELMMFPVVVDGRNFFEAETMAAAGFTYVPTGRPPIMSRTSVP